MHSELGSWAMTLAAGELPAWLDNTYSFIKVLIGFSIIIFFHELGHFLAAKWVGIRVDRFAVGFGPRLFGYRKGEGLTLGSQPNYAPGEAVAQGLGETDYCFKAFPVGGYVKMLGQDDIIINEETGEVRMSDDPRAFTNKSVGRRMIVVSAGVVFNLLLAAGLLMAVFMIGRNLPAPVIGWVDPDSPAQGKLLPDDRVISVNGRKIDSFRDIQISVMMADDTAVFKVQRGDDIVDGIEITPEPTGNQGIPMIGIDPVITTKLVVDADPVGDLPAPIAGDVITKLDGEPVHTAPDIREAFSKSAGRTIELTVERSNPDDPSKTNTVTCYQRATLVMLPADLREMRRDSLIDNMHQLGLRRRRVVGSVAKGYPAIEAGFKRGDIITQWGTVANPTYSEIKQVIETNTSRKIPVVVERNGELHNLAVKPKRKFQLFGQADPLVGIDFSTQGEEDKAIVADVAPNTPFAELNIPRGAQLIAIDDKPVQTWFDVCEVLKASAGRTVEVRYRSGDDEASGEVTVPSSVVDALGLNVDSVVLAVDGEESVAVETDDGRTLPMAIPQNPVALREALKAKLGETVKIRYRLDDSTPAQEAEFTVREDNVDPWQMRVVYYFDHTAFEPKMEPVSAHGNPIRAISMGTRLVGDLINQVYNFLTKLASRKIGTESAAGPIGIFGMAIQQAKTGWTDLMFFLAFLSVNLAVLNFLPLPVLDGGLMVFLIIEKIKGSPLSFKAQMISTMVGLAAIIVIGVVVTIQDIGRFF